MNKRRHSCPECAVSVDGKSLPYSSPMQVITEVLNMLKALNQAIVNKEGYTKRFDETHKAVMNVLNRT
jgi:hypothetical protein